MSTVFPHYLAFATHPALRRCLLAGKAVLAIDTENQRVAFANAIGARLLGESRISSVVGKKAEDSILLRQCIAAAGNLTDPGESRDFTINIQRRLHRVARQASGSLFVLDGRRYLLIECETDSNSDPLQDLVSGFHGDDAYLALVDESGATQQHTAGFERTGLSAHEIAPFIDNLPVKPATYQEHLVSTQSGIWSLALGLFSHNPNLFLLYVSEELTCDAEQMNPADINAQEMPAPPAATRSAREAIADIDESLGALFAHEGEADQALKKSPVIRKNPEKPVETPKPNDTDAISHAATETVRPLRFVWQTDGAGRLTDVSCELADAVGADMAAIVGLTFDEIETRLRVKGGSAITRLLQSADTWSGRTVEWPVSGSEMVVPVDLAALPTYTRDRHFDGFRGFGLIRLGEESVNQNPVPPTEKPAERAKPVRELNADERDALDQIANQLRSANPEENSASPHVADTNAHTASGSVIRRRAPDTPKHETHETGIDTASLDANRDAIVVQSGERVLHANPAFLSLSGYGSLDAVIDAGGPDAFVERGPEDRLFLRTADGGRLPVSFHLQAIAWNGSRALALTLRQEYAANRAIDMPILAQRETTHAPEIATTEISSPDSDNTELHAILDTATDGILILDESQTVRSLSTSASALFGFPNEDVIGENISILFAEESHGDLKAHLSHLLTGGSAGVMHEGLEVIGREVGGGLIPLFVTLGRLPRSGGICAIMRDVTALKRREEDLRSARRAAREAEEERDDLRSALRHELRQPLDAIISFSQTMDHQPFGAIGDSRYHELAREIFGKSRQARCVVGRLLGEPPTQVPELEPDQSPFEQDHEPQAQETAHEAAQINDAIAEAVSLMQPRANARRIIIRTALSPSLASTPSDAETLKEIALELLQGAVQFTPAGGQVVVSSARSQNGETVLRFRDNGIAPGRRRIAHTKPSGTEPQTDSQHLQKALKLAAKLGARLLVQAVPSEGMLVEVFLPVKEMRPLHY